MRGPNVRVEEGRSSLNRNTHVLGASFIDIENLYGVRSKIDLILVERCASWVSSDSYGASHV